MIYIKERIKLLKAAFAKLPYIDDNMHQIANYHLLKHYAENNVLVSEEQGTTNSLYADSRLIVSLTSYGKRINSVFQTVESLFRQTCKANKVVLYLSEKEFTPDSIPVTLQRQQARGLDIRYVKDIGPYTKLIPALRDFPDDLIVTVDDDYMYPFDLLERLLSAHRRQPAAVCCGFSRVMEEDEKGVLPYDKFAMNFPSVHSTSIAYLAEGFGGVLYPPHTLHDEVFNEAAFLQMAPYADDLWFKVMELMKGTPVCQIPNDKKWFRRMASEESVQDQSLRQLNIGEHKNDEQLRALFDHYHLHGKLCQ